jgi:hypothetical protein
MLTEPSPGQSIAAVVQDALTGEILWVGHLHADAPKRIAESGVVRTVGLFDGEPVSVRHLSIRGDGYVIHVESPGTRRQLDSMMPEAESPFTSPDLSEFGTAYNPRLDSGKWSKVSSPDAAYDAVVAEERLSQSVAAFLETKNLGNLESTTESAAAVISALLAELADAQVPVAKTLEAFRKHGLV